MRLLEFQSLPPSPIATHFVHQRSTAYVCALKNASSVAFHCVPTNAITLYDGNYRNLLVSSSSYPRGIHRKNSKRESLFLRDLKCCSISGKHAEYSLPRKHYDLKPEEPTKHKLKLSTDNFHFLICITTYEFLNILICGRLKHVRIELVIIWFPTVLSL